MIWIRIILFSAPLWVAGGVAWFVQQGRDLDTAAERREDADFVVLIRESERPGIFNPLMPAAGFTREITEMVFDRPFRRDDDLILRPHLVKAWEFRGNATFFFTEEAAAEKAATRIRGARDRWNEWGLSEAIREGSEIHVTLAQPQGSIPGKISEIFEKGWLESMLHVRLTLKGAVERSLQDFLSGSIEKGKIRHFGYVGDRVADIYLTGETDLFLKEFRLYYESNLNLEPTIDVMGKESSVFGLELILRLRDDVTWHDGEPFTSDDLVFTWEELARPGSPYAFRKDFPHVESVEREDAATVRVKLQERHAPILESWEKLPVLPVHRLRNAHTPEEWQAFFKNPIGTGPYRLGPRRPDGGVVLEAHAGYFRGAPRQRRIVYRVEEDPETRLLAMRLGRAEGLVPDQREKNWIDRDGRVALVRDVPRFQNFVAWNLDHSVFADARVRKGLAHLIDSDRLLEECGDDSVKPCQGLFFPGSWFCDEDWEPLPFDPDVAGDLFAGAGWKKREDRWQTAAGDEAEIRLTFDRANEIHVELAARLKAAWETAGVGVALDPADWNDMVSNRLPSRDFDALMLGWELGFGRDRHTVWHSSEAVPGGGNLSGLRDVPIDELLEKLRREDDPEAVKRLAAALQDQVRELQPCLFLCENSAPPLAVRTESVRLFRPRRDGTWSEGAVAVGRSGFFSSRPWWVRWGDGLATRESRP